MQGTNQNLKSSASWDPHFAVSDKLSAASLSGEFPTLLYVIGGPAARGLGAWIVGSGTLPESTGPLRMQNVDWIGDPINSRFEFSSCIFTDLTEGSRINELTPHSSEPDHSFRIIGLTGGFDGSSAETERATFITSQTDPLPGYEDYHSANWDGDDAEPISPETLEAARDAIRSLSGEWPPPHAAPAADGTIGFEWWNDRACIYADFGPEDMVHTYINMGDGTPSEEDSFRWRHPVSRERFTRLLGRLLRRQRVVMPARSRASARLLRACIA
jgi:hypothetical protein